MQPRPQDFSLKKWVGKSPGDEVVLDGEEGVWWWEGGAKPNGLVILRNQNQTLLSI